MKRFYCTVCKRIKRVRKMPRLIETPESENVYERVGECNRHSHAQYSDRYNMTARKTGTR